MDFRNSVILGNGIYTLRDISSILQVPYDKVFRYITKYWDGEFGGQYGEKYSWLIDSSRAVNFHTLIELDTFIKITDAGVPIRNLIKAHDILVERFDHPFPFALKNVMKRVKSAGKRIFLEEDGEVIISLDGSNQTTVDLISHFYAKIDFVDDIADRLWPLGKRNSIVCDPKRQFGSPTIYGTRINPDTLFDLYNNGESRKFIAASYDLTLKQVNDAIKFCSQAA